MSKFEHERLDVYRIAIEFLAVADAIASSLPKGRAYLADQLRRASASVPLNIAEGAGEYAAADKARFYRMARRSGTESAAILDGCECLKLCDVESLRRGRELLLRLTAMLTAMVLKLHESGSGSGSGSGLGLGSGLGSGSGSGSGSRSGWRSGWRSGCCPEIAG